jgi:hypothetical protein
MFRWLLVHFGTDPITCLVFIFVSIYSILRLFSPLLTAFRAGKLLCLTLLNLPSPLLRVTHTPHLIEPSVQ